MRYLLVFPCLVAMLGAAQSEGSKQTSLDLQPLANQKLKDADREGNNLASLPMGGQTFAGIKWKIGDGLIQLASQQNTDRPEKIEGIKVGTKCSKLYFLHATHWSANDDALVGSYTVNYEDKSQQKVPIVYGKDISDWWYRVGSRAPSRAEVAWKGENEAAKAGGAKIRLYIAAWKNPEPSRKILTIDFASTNRTDAAPFCVAITVDE